MKPYEQLIQHWSTEAYGSFLEPQSMNCVRLKLSIMWLSLRTFENIFYM